MSQMYSSSDEQDDDEEQEEEKQETSEEENEGSKGSDDEQDNEGASRGSAASDDEQDNEGANKGSAASEDEQKTCDTTSQEETHGTKRKLMSEANASEDVHTLSWIPNALSDIKSVNARILRRDGFLVHPSFKTCLPDLERVRGAAMALVTNTDAAISFAKERQSLLDRKALEQKLWALQHKLAQRTRQSRAEHRKQDALLQQANAELLKQSTLFQKEKESLTCSHKLERNALIDQYTHEQRDLKRQLEEERDKSICCVCHDKPRDTIILPCLHFQYCFPCLLRHREANSNTCPTCRGPIQGLSMSSYLATQ